MSKTNRSHSHLWARLRSRSLTRDGLRTLRADECGAATAELVLITPFLLLLILLIAQFALWLHAAHIAQAAAAQALSVTRVQGGSVTNGKIQADQVLQQLGGGPLRNPHTEVSRDLTQASVHVEGNVTAVLPFLTLRATGDAVGPVERFTSGARP